MMICVIFFFYFQVGLGVWLTVLCFWEAGDSHLGVGAYVCLHPVCSLLHPELLGFFISQIPLQVGPVPGYGVGPVGHTDLRSGTVPNLHCCAPPAATGITLHCYYGAGKYALWLHVWSHVSVSSCWKDTMQKRLTLILQPTVHSNFVQSSQIRFQMKTYSFIRETVPVCIKNCPKEGNVPYCFDARCIYSAGTFITHSDTPRHMGKMTKTEPRKWFIPISNPTIKTPPHNKEVQIWTCLRVIVTLVFQGKLGEHCGINYWRNKQKAWK